MEKVTCIAFLTAPVGLEAELAKRFCALAEATRLEPGCQNFIVHRNVRIGNRFAAFEQFRDQDAFAEHGKLAHTVDFIRWLESVGGVLQHEFWSEYEAG